MRSLSVALLALVLLSPSLHARESGHGGMGRILKKLDLTKEQKAQLKEMRSGKKDAMRALRDKKKSLHTKMKAAMASDSSEASLRKLHEEVQAAHREMADLRFEKILGVRKVLTPEQRKKFAELHDRGERRGKRGKRGKRMRGEN